MHVAPVAIFYPTETTLACYRPIRPADGGGARSTVHCEREPPSEGVGDLSSVKGFGDAL